MRTKPFRRYAAILAVAGLSCMLAPRAQAQVDIIRVVADGVALDAAIASWNALPTNSNNNLILKVSGNAEITATLRFPIGPWPGNVTIESDAGRADENKVTFIPNLTVPPGATFTVNRVHLNASVGTAGGSIVLDRVLLNNDGVALISIDPASSLTMTSCCVVGTTIQVNGSATIDRCTFFGTGLTFANTASKVLTSNIFESEPTGITLGGNFTGKLNFIPGSDGKPNFPSEFAVDTVDMLGGTPQFVTPTPLWPGKLAYQFKQNPATSLIPPPNGPATNDYEGQPINDSEGQLGADEAQRPFIELDWSNCTITGAPGLTLYEGTSPDWSPIVREGSELTVEVRYSGSGLTVTTPAAIRVYSDFLRTTGDALALPFQQYLLDDVTLVGSELVGRATISLPTDSGPNLLPTDPQYRWDGVADVRLAIDRKASGTFVEFPQLRAENTTTIKRRQIIIDSLPPQFPSGIDSASFGSLGLPPTRTCGDWSLVSGVPTGTKPYFFFNYATPPMIDFQVDLVDTIANWKGDGSIGYGGSGFVASPLASDDTQVANVQGNDAVFTVTSGTTTNVPVSKYGTAIWTNADAFAGRDADVASKTARHDSGFAVWNIQFLASAVPNVLKWEAAITITDRAGNSTSLPVELCPRFFWMPPGSTFANVTPDNDANNPQFSWSLGMTPGSNANVYDLPTNACVPTAQLLTCFASNPADISLSGWEDTENIGWTDPTVISNIDANTRMGTNGEFSLGELFARNLGQAACVMVRVTDPAGNEQDVLGFGSGTITPNTWPELNLDYDYFGGVYQIPARAAEGALDTIASARYFLNRTDRSDVSRLWNIDTDETTFGVGPNVPLTPVDACGQRLEAEITVDVAVPDNLPGNVLPSQVAVEFEVYEDGRFVAAGTLSRRGNDPSAPMKLFIPSDLLEGRGHPGTAANNSRSDPATGVLVEQEDESNGFPDPAAFLNFPPPPCESSADLHNLNSVQGAVNGYGDRLGDDGNPNSRNLDTGDVVNPYRTRSVAYTVVLRARSGTALSGTSAGALVDTTPATIHFFVKPDRTTDSGVPPIKSNKKL